MHHGYAASSRRTDDRVPLTLFDIGASTTVYLRKHALLGDHADALHAMEAEQSMRLLRLARARKIGAAQMRTLMDSLRDGITEGQARASVPGDIGPAPDDFDPFRADDLLSHRVLSGRPFQLKHLRAEAQELVSKNTPVSLFAFGPTPRKHRVQFTDGGWWEQTGGLFGPSDRSGPWIQLTSFRHRLAVETRRISATRCIHVDGDDN